MQREDQDAAIVQHRDSVAGQAAVGACRQCEAASSWPVCEFL
jgi:hypothetical protein